MVKSGALVPVFLLLLSFLDPCDSGAVQLDTSNIDKVLEDYEFVFINFYADWCRFSNMLSPIWDEGAEKISSELAGQSVLVGKIDCDAQSSLGTRFHITKYPTIKYVVNGQLAKKEYRGQRSAQAFLDFVVEQTKNPVEEFDDLQVLNKLEEKAQYVIGYFEKKESEEYSTYKKVATKLKAGVQNNLKKLGPNLIAWSNLNPPIQS